MKVRISNREERRVRSKKPIKVTIEQIKAFYALPQEKAKENERIVRKAIQKALQPMFKGTK